MSHDVRIDMADGKRVRAAEWLGISRKTLWEKLRKTTNGDGVDAAEDSRVSPVVS